MELALDTSSKLKSLRKRVYRNDRKGSHLITRLKSSYQFKNWVYDKQKGRNAVRSPYRESADLISTYYLNPATGTKTVHSLAFDLDFDKADTRWKTANGLDWELIGEFLSQTEPAIFHAITNVARSTSGRGLGVAVAISPLELTDSTKRAQISAFTLQEHLIKIFNTHGLGADPAARGIMRDMPNWFNPAKQIYRNELQRSRIDNERVAIVSELLRYTNAHPALAYTKKTEISGILWPDKRVERKLAGLYLMMFDEPGDHFLSYSQMRNLTKLSKDSLYKVLLSPPAWLKVERINKYEGYRLTLNPAGSLTVRAQSLIATSVTKASMETELPGNCVQMPSELRLPSDVEDGSRNEYLTEVTLTLKHGGIDENRATEIVEHIAGEIPGSTYSRNCRAFESIVRAIYKNKPFFFGIKGEGSIPLWLRGADEKECRKIEFPGIFKKGISKAYSRTAVLPSGEIENKPVCEYGEFEGSALICGGDAPDAAQDSDEVLRFIGSILPNLVQALQSRVDTKKPEEILSSPAILALAEEPIEMELTFGEEVTSFVPVQKHHTRYAKNLKEFSSRHPIDRFEAAFNRLFPRYGAKAIYEKLVLIHQEIIRAGHKEKYQGRASDYVPKGDPFRRIVMAFLIMSFSMQRVILRALVD